MERSRAYRLHDVTSLKRPVFPPAHHQFVPPPSRVVAIVHGQLLLDAVLHRRPPYLRFSLFVAFEYVEEFLLVGFRFGFDGREGLVGRPEVGVAAVGVEGFGGDDGGGGGFCFGGGRRGGGFRRRSWGRWSGRVFYGGFFGEEVP